MVGPRSKDQDIQKIMTGVFSKIYSLAPGERDSFTRKSESVHTIIVSSQQYYRPPIQDGPSASSHSTVVPSVAKSVSV